ncbi:glycine/betaine ABC transporter substrate-binding protein [Acetobacter lambici]|uniref:Glycine betaine ABC transporter substrate-binding protein n=1 Tax=Acetobacter lambici TaxID=1332824 RepID=A0ABT1EVQ8_9PROT|nr:glycine betaine ABC transporter substrate-binding protein [Acetobacter lambici]MCP1241286.1 glycine betaine ABC transporter substrate-binding protein [Acetobacter lambici]MCP1257044.1 glycine betaine ABC transporter substrate-binding protein [Acetobacter lambici]NHO55537.1 glycine/betaine ABC transporter substrate-binding protein [Acetobacter lambici]
MTSLTLAYPESTIHEATAATIIRVLEANDVEPEIVTGPKQALADLLRKGEIDIYVAAWLPDEDSALLSPGITQLGSLFRPEACCCISDENSPLTSLSDLAGAAGQGVCRVIVTPQSLAKRMEQALSAYHLAEAGFSLDVLPDEEALARLNVALGAETPSILPLFQPCFLFHQGGLRILDDPKKAMGKEMEATLLLRDGLRNELETDLVDELDELMLSAKIISAMDYAMRVEGMSADEAAEAWQRGKLLPR